MESDEKWHQNQYKPNIQKNQHNRTQNSEVKTYQNEGNKGRDEHSAG
jgi:hypothetical protein